jgi:hypothetical protein
VYRAVDQFGQVIDVFVSPRRDVRAARRFFQQAIGTTKSRPIKVPNGYCPDHSTGVSCPVGLFASSPKPIGHEA